MSSRRTLLTLLTLLSALLAFCIADPALAQRKPGGHKQTSERNQTKLLELEQRMKQIRRDMLRKRVGLDEQKASQVERILDKYSGERKKLRQEQRSQKRALNQLLQSDSADEAAYAKAVKAVREARRKLRALEEQQADEVGKLLTAKQQAKFLRAVDRIRRELRQKVREHERHD